jgi:hypothetical protein
MLDKLGVNRLLRGSDNGVRWGAVGAVAAAILVVAWLIFGGVFAGDSQTSADQDAVVAEALYGPAIVDEEQLRAETAGVGHTVYWLGERSGTQMELTVGADQSVQIRYLADGTEAGSTDSTLTAASWPLADALDQAQAAAKRDGGMSQKGPGGALYVTNTDTPNNAFLAQPSSTALGEVFSPKPGAAWQMVTSDKVLVLQP